MSTKFSILGEIKPGSPSVGRLIQPKNLEEKIGQIGPIVDGISVLTEPNYFFGELETLERVQIFQKPVLMKDIIVSKSQINAGLQASSFLLIKKALTKDQMEALITYIQKVNRESILEVDNETDFVSALDSEADIIAVNNRNLSDFSMDETKSKRLLQQYNPDRDVLAFSGYSDRKSIIEVATAGASGVLIGTALAQSSNPQEIINGIRNQLEEKI